MLVRLHQEELQFKDQNPLTTLTACRGRTRQHLGEVVEVLKQKKEALVKQQSVEEEDNEVIEDDVTRCICGQAEYPGPSASIREQYNNTGKQCSTIQQRTKQLTKVFLIAPSDDIGNFFVQCDNCHVWQHGGCMGLNDEAIIPDEYYCEKCRPDFHKIIKGANM